LESTQLRKNGFSYLFFEDYFFLWIMMNKFLKTENRQPNSKQQD